MFRDRLWRAAIIAAVGLCLLEVSIFVAAVYDQVLYLPGPGIGLLQHTGMLLLFVTAPLMLVISAALISAADRIASDPWEFSESYLAVTHLTDRLSFRTIMGAKRGILLALVLLGLLTMAINVTSAVSPTLRFQRDTFDSSLHPVSFWAVRLYLAIVWCGVIPVVMTTILWITYALTSLITFARQRGGLNVDWFAPDNCAGLERIGKLALFVTLALLLISSWPVANYFVFGNVRAMAVMTLFLAINSVVVAAIVLWNLHSVVAPAHAEQLRLLAARVRAAYTASDWGTVSALLPIRAELLKVNTWGLPTRYALVTVLSALLQIIISIVFSVLPNAISGVVTPN